MDKLGIARFGGITLAPDAKPTSEELAAELLASLKQIEQDIINGTIREVFCYDSQEIIDAVGMTEEEIEADRELFEFLYEQEFYKRKSKANSESTLAPVEI